MVKITVTGANRVINLKIAREIVNPDDIEMLEDLVVAAVNKAIESASKMAEEEMKKVTGFLPNIPGLNLNM
jgi:DNA-binding protein YbaB